MGDGYWGAWGSREAYLRAMVPKLGVWEVAKALGENPDVLFAECRARGIPLQKGKGFRNYVGERRKRG